MNALEMRIADRAKYVTQGLVSMHVLFSIVLHMQPVKPLFTTSNAPACQDIQEMEKLLAIEVCLLDLHQSLALLL